MTDEQGTLPIVFHPSKAEIGENDDAALAVRGDAADFLELYRRYVRAIHTYVYARLGVRQDAEDVTATVFERAWASLKNYRPTGSFRGWLFTIAHCVLADHFRKRKPATVDVDTLMDELTDSDLNLEDRVIIAEQARQVMQIVQNLTREQQEVIYLRFLADLRYRDIAQVLGKRESAVKMIAHRALKEIQRRYRDDA